MRLVLIENLDTCLRAEFFAVTNNVNMNDMEGRVDNGGPSPASEYELTELVKR